MNLNHLLLAKHLYRCGEAALSENGMFSSGVAVSFFQDAVESLMGTIAKEVGATVAPKTNFLEYWENIKKAPKAQGRTLPPNGTMIQLNNARVGFKHHGIVPDARTAAGLQLHAEEFLREACQTFFAVDFHDVSLVDLIEHDVARSHLKNAEQLVNSGNLDEGLAEAAKAQHYFEEPLESLVPGVKREAFGEAMSERMSKLETTVSDVRMFAICGALGINLLELMRYRVLRPGVQLSLTGRWTVYKWGGKKSVDDAEFAIEFTTRFGLAVQRLVGGLTERDSSLMFSRNRPLLAGRRTAPNTQP